MAIDVTVKAGCVAQLVFGSSTLCSPCPLWLGYVQLLSEREWVQSAEWQETLQLLGLRMTGQFGDRFNCDRSRPEDRLPQAPEQVPARQEPVKTSRARWPARAHRSAFAAPDIR